MGDSVEGFILANKLNTDGLSIEVLLLIIECFLVFIDDLVFNKRLQPSELSNTRVLTLNIYYSLSGCTIDPSALFDYFIYILLRVTRYDRFHR